MELLYGRGDEVPLTRPSGSKRHEPTRARMVNFNQSPFIPGQWGGGRDSNSEVKQREQGWSASRVGSVTARRTSKNKPPSSPLLQCAHRGRVALIAASTEPADSTHHPLLASKKPHAELYEIFIQYVHFSSPFSAPSSYSPPWPPSPVLAMPPKDKKDFSLPCFQPHFLPAQERWCISLALSHS